MAQEELGNPDGPGWYVSFRELIYCLESFSSFWKGEARVLADLLSAIPSLPEHQHSYDGLLAEKGVLPRVATTLAFLINHDKANLSPAQQATLKAHLDRAIDQTRKRTRANLLELEQFHRAERHWATARQPEQGADSITSVPQGDTEIPITTEAPRKPGDSARYTHLQPRDDYILKQLSRLTGKQVANRLSEMIGRKERLTGPNGEEILCEHWSRIGKSGVNKIRRLEAVIDLCAADSSS